MKGVDVYETNKFAVNKYILLKEESIVFNDYRKHSYKRNLIMKKRVE